MNNETTEMAISLPCMLVIFQLLFPLFSSATDNITQLQPFADNGSTLVSKNGTFELGFFTPGTSPNRYLGIWYKKISVRTIVWVANRENPAKQNTSMLRISREGILAIVSQYSTSVIWSANSTKNSINPVLQLLDSGNLVLREENDENPDNYLWQSFDYPTDTLLLGMKLGWDLKTGLNRRLIAWKNSSDPSPGDFIWGMDRHSNPEQMVMWRGSESYYRSGPWNGIRFSGSTSPEQHPLLNHTFVNNRDELYCSYSLENSSQIFRYFLNGTEYHRVFYIWDEGAHIWRSRTSKPRDDCDNYNICGSNGYCAFNNQTNKLMCDCLKGFEMKSEWAVGDKIKCVRSESWKCGEKKSDGFVKLTGMKMPDTTNSSVDGSMTLEQCREKCSKNCSCSAYSNLDIRGGGSGCVMWFGDLVDVRTIPEAGQDLHIRWDPTEIEKPDGKFDGMKRVAMITIVVSLSLMVLITFCCIYWRKRKFRDKYDEGGQEDLDLPLFRFDTIAHATNDFSGDNLLGKGGFGPVYKGTLPDQEIAVKRLSKISRQGVKEFKNEVILCAKLQHRNLVKVLGYCVHKKEKLVVYEYMPNKSLDSFLFAQNKVLDWPKRFHIIYRIARGLLYLHHDSRLKIIHRDLKASNILLDKELNPKISDFGIARMFREDEIEGKTESMAGTYGYMAPEIIDGQFSIKSDVFSFGILLLEIISGKRNKGILYPRHGVTLIGHAWRLWKEGVPLEFLDPCLGHSCNPSEVLRCMHIGLLCVQQHPLDRPNMASVVVMLNNESALPQPKEPAFFMERTSAEEQVSSGEKTPYSINEITYTQLEPR